ncbi:thioredoxin family protein [Phaeobacter sp.]|uniref:DUF1223 domain-containing protein n=1 Tax=Phaeobacter sp. TaxID=1902409 RepID=UPI0025E043AB|nr:DUF1223 domain-containing protein [Phaeobacter sp.]
MNAIRSLIAALSLAMPFAGGAVAQAVDAQAADPQAAGSVAFELQKPLVVVELFTSQGCSSCPPADALLHQLTKRNDVLPLALHVDYWDYIGWKDQFASPEHTRRQKGYAQIGGRQMVYTPQMIIHGQDDVVGADAMKLADAIAAHRGRAEPVEVSLAPQADGEVLLTLTASGAAAMPDGPVAVQLVRYTPLQTVDISRGELAGHRLSYANVVEQIDRIANWDGAEDLTLRVALTDDLPAAVIVQAAPFGRVLAAARLQ